LIRHYGAGQADVLGFSYGGGIAMRVVDQHAELVCRLILASTTAYQDYEQERAASPDRSGRRCALKLRGMTRCSRAPRPRMER
jgi:pimeloyl-ACP methyl ester carboxylesterase